MFEFLYGSPPFNAKDVAKVFENIVALRISWSEDIQISHEARDLIVALLDVNSSTRIGSQGAQQVKSHVWFNGLDWSNLLSLPVMFHPNATAEDTIYFDSRGVGKMKSETNDFVDSVDFGKSVYKNLNILNKQNQEIVGQINKEMQSQGDEWLKKRRDSIPLARKIHSRNFSAEPKRSIVMVVANDNPDIIEWLREFNFHVTVCQNIQEALFHQSQQIYPVIFTNFKIAIGKNN